jgi:hypothetical protein
MLTTTTANNNYIHIISLYEKMLFVNTPQQSMGLRIINNEYIYWREGTSALVIL